MATIGTLVAQITGDTSGLRRAERDAKKHCGGIEGSLKSMKRIAITAFAGWGVSRIAKSIGSLGMTFDRSMSIVKVTSRATATEFIELSGAARKMGQETEFSAAQSADALKFLAMAGLSVNQQLKALPQMLNLATAGQLDLAYAADLSTNIMTQMGLKVEDLTRVNDALAATAATANTNIQEMGQAFVYAGAKARAFDVDIEELSAMIGLLANAGIKAMMAGTTIRQSMLDIIRAVADPGGMKATVLDKYDIAVIDEGTGKLRSYVEILKDLADANLSVVDASQLFGARAANITLILDQGRPAIEAYIARIKLMEGVCQEMADTIRQDVRGAFDSLRSVIGEYGLRIWDVYREDVKAAFRLITQTMRSHFGDVDSFAKKTKGFLWELAESVWGAFNVMRDAIGIAIDGLKLLGKSITLIISMFNILELAARGWIAAFDASEKGGSKILEYWYKGLADVAEGMADVIRNMEEKGGALGKAFLPYADQLDALSDKARIYGEKWENAADIVDQSAQDNIARIEELQDVLSGLGEVPSSAGNTIAEFRAQIERHILVLKELGQLEEDAKKSHLEFIASWRDPASTIVPTAKAMVAASESTWDFTKSLEANLDVMRTSEKLNDKTVFSLVSLVDWYNKVRINVVKIIPAIEELTEAQRKNIEEFLRIHEIADPQVRAIEQLRIKYEALAKQIALLPAEEAAKQMERMRKSYENDLAIIVDKTEETTTEVEELWTNAMDRVQSTMADTFMDAMKGKLNSFKDIFKSFCDILLRYWAEMLAQMVMQSNVLKGITAGLGGIFGGMFGGGGTAQAGTAGITQQAGFSLLGGLAQGFGNMGSSLLGFMPALTTQIGEVFYQAGWNSGYNFTYGVTEYLSGAGSILGGALTAGIGTFLISGLLGGDWAKAAVQGGGAGAGAAAGGAIGSIVPGIGTAIGAAIGAIVGGIAGMFGASFLGGNKKRSYYGKEFTYGDYSLESGWGEPTGSIEGFREDRGGKKAFGEAGESMAQSGLDLMNMMDSMFKDLLEVFGGEAWVSKFSTQMIELAAQKPSFDFKISAEDKGEFKDDWRDAWKEMSEDLIAPIAAIGADLLGQALDSAVTDNLAWKYFSDAMRDYLKEGLESSLEDLQIDWSTVTDEESFEAATKQMGLAADQIAAIMEYFTTIGGILEHITTAIDMHGFSDSARAAVQGFSAVNDEFAQYAVTLESLGVDLEKLTDLEEVHQLALQDVAYAMAQAGISGEDLSIALQYVSDEMLNAGNTAEDVAAMYESAAIGVERSINEILDATFNALAMAGMNEYERQLYEINQRYQTIASQLIAVNQLYDKQGNLTDTATRAISAYNLEIQNLANTILNTIRNTQRQLATMGMESGRASMLGIASRYGVAPSALQGAGQDILSWYAQADPQAIAETLAGWGVSIDQFNADMITLGNYYLNQSGTQHQEAQATRNTIGNEIINSLNSAIGGIESMLADLSSTGKYAPVQSAEAFQFQYEKLIEQIRVSGDPGKYVSQLQSFLPDYMSFMGAYGGDYKNLVSSVQKDLGDLSIELKSERDYLQEISQSTGNIASNTNNTASGIGQLLNLGIPISFNTTGLDTAAVAFLQGLKEIVSLVGWNSPFTIDFVSNYTGFMTMPFDDFCNVLSQVAEKVPGGWYAQITMDMIMSFENWDDATLQEKLASWNAIRDVYGWHSPVTFEFMADMVDTGDITWAEIVSILPDKTVEKELIMFLNNQTGMSTEDLSNIFGRDTVANMHIGADLIWPEGGFLDVVVGNAVTLAKFGNMNADTWTNNLYIGVIEMWKELVKIRQNTAALNVGLDLPSYASGGLTHGLSYAGESGSEWIVPTYEPQRSSFLRDVGADPEEIGKAVAKYLVPMVGANNGEKEIHVHLAIDGQDIRNPVIVGLRGRDSELIEATRRATV